MKLIHFFTLEYILIGIILVLIIPFSYLFASQGNYAYSIPIVLFSVIYLYVYPRKLKVTRLRSIIIAYIVITIITSYSYYFYNLHYTSYLSFISNAIIPFVLFLVIYTYSSRKRSELFLLVFFVFYYAIGLYYINYQQSIRESMLLQINNFYFVIAPLPFLFLIEKPFFRSLFLVLSTFCVVVSLKRSGFIIIVLLLLYTTYYYTLSRGKLKRKFWFILFFVAVVGVAYNYMQSLDVEYYDRMITRIENTKDDGGSGRTSLLKKSQQKIGEMNVIELLIGKGFSACDSEDLNPLGYASFHNDYSEMMYSYGIIGMLLLFGFIMNLFNKCRYAWKNNNRYRYSLMSSIIIFVVFSVTSSVFHYTYYMLPLFMYWGYVDAQFELSKQQTKNMNH